ncbi:MAG: DUF1657 domain-containing protein [Bacillota bacterium]|nr:DUF1657 domain-containing protein [Clostridia bacterium]
MTVGDQMEQAIASIQSASANMKQFAQQTMDKQAQQTFQQLSQTMDDALTTLKGRQQYIQEQEPQYKQ